ncbi:cation-transporting P-type ATPase [Lacrimispora amygdalina]|uniref:cation-transporting P-type ATPase n=1 Tax=Lacrimispora amygdalina TaxID=253257 RepID=UPI0035C89935
MAEESRESYGNNVITHGKKDSIWKRIWAAFVNPFTSILFLLTVVSVLKISLIWQLFQRTMSLRMVILKLDIQRWMRFL